MRIITVATIKHNVVSDIESFGIFDERQAKETIKRAEDYFYKKVTETDFIPFNDESVKKLFEDGFYIFKDGAVSMAWTDTDPDQEEKKKLVPNDLLLVCNECGNSSVEVTAWIDANTSEYKDEVGDDRTYCANCDATDVGLTTLDQFLEKAAEEEYNNNEEGEDDDVDF